MQKGIWQHNEISQSVESQYRLSLGEGDTELQLKEFDGKTVYFKHEEKNPSMSFKDRSLAYWLSFYNSKGQKNFVISSSGNAAVSAIAYCKLMSANLKVFVSENIPEYKYNNIIEQADGASNIEIEKVTRPKSDAIKFAFENKYINLRGSVDDLAIKGFETLGMELLKQNSEIDAIFTCCSSGTSTIGMYGGYKRMGSTIPEIHVVQTTKINPIASKFDSEFIKSSTSLANAVSDKIARRKNTVVEIVKVTKGNGWVVSNEDLEDAKKSLIELGINIEGYNAYVSFAGYKKALKAGYKFQNPVCIISGV